MESNYLLKLDLQLFADDGGAEFGAYDPASAYDGIETPSEPQDPGFQQPNTFEQPQNPELQTQPDFLDFGGRKVPALDPELQGLHKDFTEQQRYITALQEQVNAYKQLATVQTQQPQAPQQPEVSHNVEEWTEETWQKFYDNPQDIIGNMVQRLVSEKVDPIVQERQWNNEIQRMYDSYPDFEQFIGDVQNLVNQYPDRYADREGGLEEAYYRAKATYASGPTPEQLAQDPQFLQTVMSNPQVQNQVLNQYFQQKQQTQQQLPPVMGRGAGGFTPQTPDNSPTTLREASRQFMRARGL